MGPPDALEQFLDGISLLPYLLSFTGTCPCCFAIVSERKQPLTRVARFTQSEITKLLKAGKVAGFRCATVDVLAEGGLRATYSAAPVTPEEPNEWDVVFQQPLALKTRPKKRDV